MAGMFGLFDYTKEGPGISKKGPRKRPFVIFFEIYGRKFWNLMLAGLMFLLVNLPLLTRGLADAGLTFVTRAFSREKHAFVKEDFWESIRKNGKQAFGAGLLNQLLTALMFFNFGYYALRLFPALNLLLGADPAAVSQTPAMQLDLMNGLVLGATVVGYLIFTWMKYYIPFMVVTFRLSFKQLYRNAFIFAAAGLKQNLLISVVMILVYALFGGLAVLSFVVLSPMAVAVVALLFLLLVPAFRSFLIQFTIFPVVKKLMIDPYYRDNPQADKQARLDLNLDVEEAPTPAEGEEKPAEETIFSDERPAEAEESHFPKQYSQREMRRFNNARHIQQDDDDETI